MKPNQDQTKKEMKRKSLNLKKLAAVLVIPAAVFGGVAYWVLTSDSDEPMQPIARKNNSLAPARQNLNQTQLPAKNTQSPTLKPAASKLSNSVETTKTAAAPVSTDTTTQQQQQVAVGTTTKVPSTVELLTTNEYEVLVQDPFATSAISAAGEQIAAQQQILKKRTELASQLASFLQQKVQIMDLQQKLADAEAAKEAREAEEDGKTPSASERFLEDKTTVASSDTQQQALDRFKVPEITSSTSADVYEDIEEPEPIDVLGIISSSNTGSILILKDGRRLPLKVGSRLNENWKIQKVNINEEKADITFETNDHSKTSMQTVVF